MKALFFTLSLMLSLNSFGIQGQLEVTQDSLRILRDDGFKVHFYKGIYSSSLIFKDQKAYLAITRKDIITNAILKFPVGASIPENGTFILDGGKTGQTFSISGVIDTETINSETIREQESCQYPEDEYICRGRGRQRECRWETVWYNGLREIEYYYQTKNIKLASDLASNNGGKANFTGQSSDRNKIFLYVGQCR